MAIDNDNMSRAAKLRNTTYPGSLTKNTIVPFVLSAKAINLRSLNVQIATTPDTDNLTISVGKSGSAAAYGTFTLVVGDTGNKNFTAWTLSQVPANTAVLLSLSNNGGAVSCTYGIDWDVVDDVPQVVN